MPTLKTERLTLRPFAPGDAGDVQRLAGDRAIAEMTRTIPHPYADGVAEQWIATHQAAFEAGDRINFAITLSGSGELVGAAGLILEGRDRNAELGYWIGRPYWRCGYATEAARAVLGYGFEVVGLHRIHAAFLAHNPASGRVLEKLGMAREGVLREHMCKEDRFGDLVVCGLLAREWAGGL